MAVVSDALRRLPPTSVGEADLGARLALLGPVGQCVFTHSIRGVECARDVRAAWRALFFLIQEEPATMPGSETPKPILHC